MRIHLSTHITKEWSCQTQESSHPRSRKDNVRREAYTHSDWAEPVNIVVYLMNCFTTSEVHAITPHEKYYGKKPDLSYVPILCSNAYVHIPNEKWQKLEPELEKCIHVGYSLEQKGYKFFKPSTQKVHVSQDIVFNEPT